MTGACQRDAAGSYGFFSPDFKCRLLVRIAASDVSELKRSVRYVATIEATEEAIYNATFCARTVSVVEVCWRHYLDRVIEILRKHDLIERP